MRRMRTQWGRASALAVGLTMACSVAQADAVASLRAFVKDVQTGRGEFTQTVTSPDGKVYMFRSTRKYEPRNLPEDLRDTPAGALISGG